MPINRTTPKDPPVETHVFIQAVEISGLAPGQTTVVVFKVCAFYDNDPPNEDWQVATGVYTHTLTGEDADSWITANQTTYDAAKTACYQKLIDDGIEAGTIE